MSALSAEGPSSGAAAGARRLKVVLVISETEDYAIAFANGLARHADVVLCVPRRRFAARVGDLAPQVDLRLLDWPRHRSLRNPLFVAALARLVRRERPDIVHLLSNTILWLNLCLPLWRDIATVTTVHDVETHPGDTDTRVIPHWSRTLAVRQSPDIVVHGEQLRSRAVARFGKPAGRVHVLPHPTITRYADLARRRGMAPRRGERFTVLLFGRIFAYKGLADLLRAEALIGERVPGLRIVVAGRGDAAGDLRHLMGDPARYDIRNRFIDDEETAQLFLDADLVALPYTEASQSGVLNIAAAFGRPVVATVVGELGATVAEHRLGQVVPPGDPARLAEAIVRMATQPALAAEAGAAARRWAEGPNAPDQVGMRACELYQQILSRRPSAGLAADRRPGAAGVARPTRGKA